MSNIVFYRREEFTGRPKSDEKKLCLGVLDAVLCQRVLNGVEQARHFKRLVEKDDVALAYLREWWVISTYQDGL